MDKTFIAATEALRKLKHADELKKTIYIYGVSGYGKTTLVKQYLGNRTAIWLSARNNELDLSEFDQISTNKRVKILVVDDLQFLDNRDTRNQLVALAQRDDIWVIMIGRMITPEWTFPIRLGGQLVVISEEDLMLGVPEIKKMATNYQVKIQEDTLELLVKESLGNALGIVMFLEYARDGKTLTNDVLGQAVEMYKRHLEENVMSQWRGSLQEFLMKMSIVDSFNAELAETITGDDQAIVMIENAMNIGNFLLKQGDTYSFREQILSPLRNQAHRKLGTKKIQQCKYNAGLYYEMHGEALSAIEMYEACDENERIKNILIRSARRHPGIAALYDLRKYYLRLSEEEIQESAVLMATESLLYAILLDTQKSEYWYQKLATYAESVEEDEKREAIIKLFYLDIALPHRGSVNLIDLLKKSFTLVQRDRLQFPELSVTNNQPSAMNGGKDFCEWSKKDEIIAASVGTVVSALLGDFGKGIVPIGLAESFYEKGKDSYTVINQISKAMMAIEGGGKTELMFVAVGLQVRLALMSGDIESAIQLLDGFEERAIKLGANNLYGNISALRCRIALRENNLEFIHRWMIQAPDENVEFCTLERYRYMTKVRCYLHLGRNAQALLLLGRMKEFAEISKRTYIHMECNILLAITLYRFGDNWQEPMLEALREAESYHFVRLFSEEGAALISLLKEIKKEYLSEKNADQKWFQKVLVETEQVANRYPGYLSNGMVCRADFSEEGIKVLRLQASGETINEIAEHMGISPRTVKYHAAENYKKLGAKGKADALQKARGMKLL